jgi:hypothetical protein
MSKSSPVTALAVVGLALTVRKEGKGGNEAPLKRFPRQRPSPALMAGGASKRNEGARARASTEGGFVVMPCLFVVTANQGSS